MNYVDGAGVQGGGVKAADEAWFPVETFSLCPLLISEEILVAVYYCTFGVVSIHLRPSAVACCSPDIVYRCIGIHCAVCWWCLYLWTL